MIACEVGSQRYERLGLETMETEVMTSLKVSPGRLGIACYLPWQS